jgi:hypothetical protein
MSRPQKTESSPDKVICTVCRKEKKLDEFFPDTRRAIGVTSACRECMMDKNNYSKYKAKADKEGIESLYEMREKQTRTLRILNQVIDDLETGKS